MGNRKNIINEVGSILIFTLGVFAFFALLSYQSLDPSFFSQGGGTTSNACGRLGAYFSSFVLHLFGLGGFLVPGIFFFIASNIHKRESFVKVFGTLSWMTLAVSALTVFLAIQWKNWAFGGSSLL